MITFILGEAITWKMGGKSRLIVMVFNGFGDSVA